MWIQLRPLQPCLSFKQKSFWLKGFFIDEIRTFVRWKTEQLLYKIYFLKRFAFGFLTDDFFFFRNFFWKSDLPKKISLQTKAATPPDRGWKFFLCRLYRKCFGDVKRRCKTRYFHFVRSKELLNNIEGALTIKCIGLCKLFCGS